MSVNCLVIFMFLRNFIIELNCLSSWLCLSHKTCTLTLFEIFSWFCFHEYNLCYIDFECWWSCDLHVFHGIHSYFIPCSKDFVLVFKIYHKTSSYSSFFVEFSNMLNLFSNLFLKTPTLMGGWLGDHALYVLYWKSF